MKKVITKLMHNLGFIWFTLGDVSVKGYAFNKNGMLLKENKLALLFETVDSKEDLFNILFELNGLFAVVVKKDDKVFAAVDPTRTFPLFYIIDEEEVIITDDISNLNTALSLNKVSKEEFLYTGYVTGKETLLENVFQIKSGSFIYINKNFIEEEYINFTVNKSEIVNADNLELKLFDTLENSIKRLVESSGDKTIVIPLSGGYDSRLIATLLKKFEFTNVICFSYGVKGSIDAEISQEIAKRLNFKWLFVDYDNIDFNEEYLESKEFEDYYKFAFNMVSVFLLQDFFAIKYLHDNNLIPQNSIIVPGHSGDFLVGNHLYPFDKRNFSYKNLRNQIIKRHFVLRAYFKNNAVEKKILDSLPKNKLSYSILDNYNLKERQSKFIVNANRVYEFFGYEHRIPLWDSELVEFFRVLSFDQKINSKLYFKTIIDNIFIPFKVFIIPPDKNKSRLKRTLKEYIPMFISYYFRLYLHNKKPLNTEIGYFKILKPMVNQFNFKSYNVNGILSKWLVKKHFPDTDIK